MVVVNTPQLVRPYNGTTSWTSFRDHFKRMAKVNRWDDNVTQAQHLMLALERNAAELLKEISDTSPTVLQDICDALCRRFGEVDEAREAMRKFEQRRQLDSESVVEFEQALRSLYRVAWPKATPEQKEVALKTGFEEGLVCSSSCDFTPWETVLPTRCKKPVGLQPPQRFLGLGSQ